MSILDNSKMVLPEQACARIYGSRSPNTDAGSVPHVESNCSAVEDRPRDMQMVQILYGCRGRSVP